MKLAKAEKLIAVNLYYKDEDGSTKIFTLYKQVDGEWHALGTYLKILQPGNPAIPYGLPVTWEPTAKMKRIAERELARRG